VLSRRVGELVRLSGQSPVGTTLRLRPPSLYSELSQPTLDVLEDDADDGPWEVDVKNLADAIGDSGCHRASGRAVPRSTPSGMGMGA
jgi:hypothetical protein